MVRGVAVRAQVKSFLPALRPQLGMLKALQSQWGAQLCHLKKNRTLQLVPPMSLGALQMQERLERARFWKRLLDKALPTQAAMLLLHSLYFAPN